MTFPSLRAACRTVPTTWPRLAISSCVATTMSLLTERSPSDRRISMAARRLSCTSFITTRRSTSLPSMAVPRAQEPKSTTREGWNRPTMRSTMTEMTESEVILYPKQGPLRYFRLAGDRGFQRPIFNLRFALTPTLSLQERGLCKGVLLERGFCKGFQHRYRAALGPSNIVQAELAMETNRSPVDVTIVSNGLGRAGSSPSLLVSAA